MAIEVFNFNLPIEIDGQEFNLTFCRKDQQSFIMPEIGIAHNIAGNSVIIIKPIHDPNIKNKAPMGFNGAK